MRNRGSNGVVKRFMSVAELQEYLSVGESLARKIGKESGAAYKIGRRVSYDINKIDAYLDRKNAVIV